MLVSNGTDTSHFRFSDRGPTDRRIVGSVVTRLSKKNAKRFWLTVDVIHRLRARGVACEFVGFGASEVPESELPSGSRVEIRPSQTRIAEIYASCDCWLFTSEKEGYGLPLLEAMACGTPVVATPAGAAPELLASGGGTLVDSDDPEAIADAVEAILNLDEGSWRAMSRAARAEAEKHSWDLIGDQMEAALLQILSEGR
jgi:glycosyltransferase involved in cell wall biosynthesis